MTAAAIIIAVLFIGIVEHAMHRARRRAQRSARLIRRLEDRIDRMVRAVRAVRAQAVRSLMRRAAIVRIARAHRKLRAELRERTYTGAWDRSDADELIQIVEHDVTDTSGDNDFPPEYVMGWKGALEEYAVPMAEALQGALSRIVELDRRYEGACVSATIASADADRIEWEHRVARRWLATTVRIARLLRGRLAESDAALLAVREMRDALESELRTVTADRDTIAARAAELERTIELAVGISVDAALGEVARHQGGIADPIGREARGAGLTAAIHLWRPAPTAYDERHCSRLDEFFDRELDDASAAAFRFHLPSCTRCQQVLHGRMQEAVATGRACDKLVRFADGEIEPAEAEAFRAHLRGCERCRAALVEANQLAARLSTLTPDGGQ